MSNEKHYKNTQPEFDLDELNGIPGETPLDKTLAWEKLYPRLHKIPGRKKTGWYWVAAAGLLCMMGIYGIGWHTEREMAGNNPKSRPEAGAAVQQPSTVKANPSYRKVPEPKRSLVIQPGKARKSHFRSPARNEFQSVAKKEADSSAYPGNQSGLQAENENSIMRNSSQPVPSSGLSLKMGSGVNDDPAADANAGVSKRKLRVVHLNELDEPAESTNNLVKNSGRHTLRIKWMEQTVNSDRISERTYSQNDLVKINLPSSN